MGPNDEQQIDNIEPEDEILGDGLDEETVSEDLILEEEVPIPEPDFSDELLFPTYQHGKNIAKALDATQIYLSEILSFLCKAIRLREKK